MIVNRESWHYRWYSVWDRNWDQRDHDYESPNFKKRPKTENLCHYMRVIMIWGPIWWLIMGRQGKKIRPPYVILSMIPIGIVITLIATLGWETFLLGGLALVGAIALILGVLFLISLIVEAVKDRRDKKPYTPKKPKEPNIFWEYTKAKKKKICPLIEFEGGE